MAHARLQPRELAPVPASEGGLPAAMRQPRPKTVRRGIVASLVAPLAAAVAVLVLATGLLLVGGQWWAGWTRDTIYSRAVQPDASAARVVTGAPVEETVTILVRDADGLPRRLVAERSAADAYVNDTLRRLDRERARIKALATAETQILLEQAFADADAAIERHADWFFAWKRSFVVLKQALVSTTTRLVQVGNPEPLRLAVERDLEDYFRRHYTVQVLEPERRDALVGRGFEQAARRAHERWLSVVAAEELRLQLFLSLHTRHLEPARADERISAVVLDWDAQRFKAPVHLAEDKAFDGLVSLAAIGAGATLGAMALGPVLERATRGIFARLGRNAAAMLGRRAALARTGAMVGGAVQPVGGAALGAVAGGLLALVGDYAANELSARLNREGFVEAHKAAVALTVELWHDRLEAGLHAAIDRWFDDTRAAVVAEDPR